MNFYDLMQLDVYALRGYISKEESKKGKMYYMSALLTKSILTVLFAVSVISAMSFAFGTENSGMAVFIFCIFMSMRFIGYNYNIKDSIIGLAVVYVIMFISPVCQYILGPYAGILINFMAITTILVITSDRPEYGNAGIYMFGYVFAMDTNVTMEVMTGRFFMFIVGFVACSIVMYRNNKHKDKHISFKDILAGFRMRNKKSRWMIKVAAIMSVLFFIGEVVNIDKFIWAGFACASIITAYEADFSARVKQRTYGIVMGTILFVLICSVMPAGYMFIVGPIAGIIMGLCTEYRNKTACNCFGALAMARGVYGTGSAAVMRIANNIGGSLLALFGIYAISVVVTLFRKLNEIENYQLTE